MATRVCDWLEEPRLRGERRSIAQAVTGFEQENLLCLTQLFANHRKKLLRAAMRITHNQDEAEDVVQEAALRAMAKLPTFRGDSRLETWIYAILSNCALSRLRSPARRRLISLDSELNTEDSSPRWIALDEAGDPEGNCLACELRQIVRSEIEALKAPYRSVLKLCDLEGWTCAEAAAILNVNPHTLEAHLYRGRRNLRTSVLSRLFGGVHSPPQVKYFRVHTAKRPRRKKARESRGGA